MSMSDKLLGAYVDGELSESERSRVEQAMAQDATVAQRVERQQALRNSLREAYDEVLAEPIPEHLVQAARLVGSSEPRQIIDLAATPAKLKRGIWGNFAPIPVRAVIAASLLIGVLVGLIVARLSWSGSLIELRSGTMVARGVLATTLDQQLADAVPLAASIRVGLSFRAKSGNYCRTFTTSGAGLSAGLACREARQWQILTAVEAVPRGATSQYRMASSTLPPLLLQAVRENMRGEPLDAQAERNARSSGWR